MLKPIIILLIFSICLLQQINADANVKSVTNKDDVKKAFHKMMEIVDKALTEAQTALDKAMNEVNKTATNIEQETSKALDKVLDPLRKKLDELIQKAKDKGFDVTKCQKYIDAFTHIPNDLSTNVIGCVTTQVKKAKDAIDDALANMKQLEQDLNNIDKDIDDCDHGSEFKKIKCYAKLMEKIAKDTEDAPKKIAKDVANVTFLITEIVPIMEACAAGKLKDAETNAAKDVADFGICAAVGTSYRYI